MKSCLFMMSTVKFLVAPLLMLYNLLISLVSDNTCGSHVNNPISHTTITITSAEPLSDGDLHLTKVTNEEPNQRWSFGRVLYLRVSRELHLMTPLLMLYNLLVSLVSDNTCGPHVNNPISHTTITITSAEPLSDGDLHLKSCVSRELHLIPGWTWEWHLIPGGGMGVAFKLFNTG